MTDEKQNDDAPIATVINNNQPGWTNIIETAPNVTLATGTKLYLRPQRGATPAHDMTEMREKIEAALKDNLDVNEKYCCIEGWTDAVDAVLALLSQSEPERGDAVCEEADGCPTEKSVLQRFWRQHHALLSQSSPSGGGMWRPIETAPKDGTEFDAWAGNAEFPRRVVNVSWREPTDSEWWVHGGDTIKTPDATWHDEHGPLPKDEWPTHWMPLPTPPITEAQSENTAKSEAKDVTSNQSLQEGMVTVYEPYPGAFDEILGPAPSSISQDQEKGV